MSDSKSSSNVPSNTIENVASLLAQTKLTHSPVNPGDGLMESPEETVKKSRHEEDEAKTTDKLVGPLDKQAQAVSTVPCEENLSSDPEEGVDSEHKDAVHVNPDEISAYDFSHIRNLGLTHTDQLKQLLTDVPIEQLSELTSLRLRFYSAAHVEDHESFINLLTNFLKTLKSLDSFQITCDNYQTICPVDTICEIGTTLKHLYMLGADGYGGDQLSVTDLEKLLTHCPNLESLVVDMPMFPFKQVQGYDERALSSFEAREFLAVLPRFAKLKNLKLRAEYGLGTESPMLSSSTDPDYDDAMRILKELHGAKQGVPFEWLSVQLERSFQPRNWRPAGVEEEEGRPVFENYWCPRREFCSGLSEKGEYIEWVAKGSDRVGDVPDESAEVRAHAEAEYEEYLKATEWPVKNSRPLFCCGMEVWLVDGVVRARDDDM